MTCNDDAVSMKRSSTVSARIISYVTQYECDNDDDDDDDNNDDTSTAARGTTSTT
jgi:hypothetical protein